MTSICSVASPVEEVNTGVVWPLFLPHRTLAANTQVIWWASIRIIACVHNEKEAAIWKGLFGVSGMEVPNDGVAMHPVFKVRSLGLHASSSLWVEAGRANEMVASILAHLPPVCKGLDVIQSLQPLGQRVNQAVTLIARALEPTKALQDQLV